MHPSILGTFDPQNGSTLPFCLGQNRTMVSFGAAVAAQVCICSLGKFPLCGLYSQKEDGLRSPKFCPAI
jgi:hypothetical protein